MKKIAEMSKIENEYILRHDNNFQTDIPENTTVLPQQAFVGETEAPVGVRMDTQSLPRMGFIGGRFQVRR
jgi:hypothetical protein